jgi:hypothetical protein
MLNDADDEESKGYLKELEEAATRSGWEPPKWLIICSNRMKTGVIVLS